MGSDTESDLAVLVCSANVGNAEPTSESFGEMVPNDGEIEGPLANTKYPVDVDGAAKARASLNRPGKKFDIIVIGMQEAAFSEKKTIRKSPDHGEGGALDGSNRGAESSERSDSNDHHGVVETVNDGVSEILKEGEKGKSKLFRKVVKANMIVRGLTTSQTYRAPALRNSATSRVYENAAVRSGSYDTRKFLKLIEERCPSYGMVTSKLRGEMRLIVLALKDLTNEISDVYIAGENTGIGSVLANKGGIIATFDLRGTRLSFMTCHLEAHEGATHYTNRNKNLAEIFAGAKTDPNYNLHDATIISHHMFVCGDLNYRIKFGESGPTARKKSVKRNLKVKANGVFSKPMTSDLSSRPPPLLDESDIEEKPLIEEKTSKEPPSPSSANLANGSHFARAKALVEAEDWKTLNDGDELAMALKKKECLAGFTTLPCNFPPTFKVARGEGYQYNEKRTPSYTDRILWKSADGMADNVVPFLYEPCPDFITSDHKPIRGGYSVKMNRGPPGQTSSPAKTALAKHSERQVHLLVSDIKCTNLPIMDAGVMGGLSDPYILFVSSPKPMLWKQAWPSTKVIKKNLNPVWQQDMHLTLDQDACKDDSLNGAMLFMTVMDEDFSSGDDVIGTVALNLNDLCSTTTPFATQTTEISRPVLRNGQQQFGMLECTISSAYLTAKETKAFLKIAKRKVRSKTRHTSITNKIFALLPF
mmetsp:Transcript_6466/g.14595  ORF Transcript_6466/g.14595 Transcript_6466/m.14595 type:complete len:702 (-) Transcript_6466:819-2924(-)